MTKTMLITGGARGVGAACAKAFNNEYRIVTVGRSGKVTELGDLNDRQFCDHLIERYTPSVFINNAAVIDTDFWTTASTNFTAAGYLAIGFYNKMRDGHIINVSSVAGRQLKGHLSMPRVAYHASKAAMNALSELLAWNEGSRVKVTNLCPGWINTGMGTGKSAIALDQPAYDRGINLPMRPSDIADAVRWVISQPKHLHMSNLEIKNHRVDEEPDPPVRKTDLSFPRPELLLGVIDALTKYPLDERNQLCLTSRVGTKDPLYDGVGKLEGAESDYRVFNEEFRGTFLETIYNRVCEWSPHGIGRVRIMRMGPKSCYSMHADKTMRYHLAVMTDRNAYLVFHGQPPFHIPMDGHLYETDTQYKHTAMNTADTARIHLVFCTYPR